MPNQDEKGMGCENEHLNFLIYAPGILKRTFKEGLENAALVYRNETGHALKTYGPVEWPDCSNREYEDIWKVNDIDHFPDVVSAMGFGDFVRREFVEKFVRKGSFKCLADGPMNRAFEEAGFLDPRGWYTPYAVVPFVMLVDRRRLGNLEAPRCWEDLLDPRFHQKLIISSTGEGAANVPILYMYKEFGEEGIAKLAANIKGIWSAARIAREAGSFNEEGAAVYILSWFFAHSCPRIGDTVSVVWPEDGAFTSPLYLLVKASKVREMKPVVEYVTGKSLGIRSARVCLPTAHPGVDNGLPPGASLNWLGWDYVQSNDTAELREYSHALFMSKLRSGDRLWPEEK